MENKNIFTRIMMIILPMFIYIVLQLVCVNGGYWVMIFIGGIIGKENPVVYGNQLAMENLLLLNMIASLIALPIFSSIYKKERNMSSYFDKTYSLDLLGKFIWIIPFGLFAMLAANYFVSFLILFMPKFMIESYTGTQSAIDNAPALIQIISATLMAPAVEELIFRGVIYNRLKKIMSIQVAAIVSSILFGVFHLNWLQAPYAFIIGLLAVFIYEKYQTIFASIFFHGMANLFSLLSMFLVNGKGENAQALSDVQMMIGLLILIGVTSTFELLFGMIIYKRVDIKEIKENEIINDYDSML